MVSTAGLQKEQPSATQSVDIRLLLSPLRYCSVPMSQIMQNGTRLDASAYDIEAIMTRNQIERNPYGWVYLWGKDGLVRDAYYPGRYKRIYTSEEDGEPFYLPSQLEEVYPQPTKYLSHKTAKLLEKDRIKDNSLLLSRSGTIGKCAVSSKATIGKLFSDDVIRVSFNGAYDLGYTYAFFKTSVGLKLLQSNNYGAVIDHIEPEHLSNIPIPNAPDEVKRQIHEAVVASYELRDQSNALIDKARQLLYDALQLPAKPHLSPRYYAPDAGFRCFSVPFSHLNRRLDASYHLPEADEVLRLISKHAKEVTTLGDPRISKEIILPGRFKRIYVEKGKGVPFFGGKQLLQLNPSSEKYLSFGKHANRIDKELALEENMCAVTCSGTIGKIMIVPKHWQGWALNQHVMRIVPVGKDIAGYIYAWLSTDYAQPLIVRHTYGAVVDEIDDLQLSEVPIPLLQEEATQRCINELVLQANELRYQAYIKEQEAITQMNDVLSAQ